MERSNNQTNKVIMWAAIVMDILLMNGIACLVRWFYPQWPVWGDQHEVVFFLVLNLALAASEGQFHTRIQGRLVSAGHILRRAMLLVGTFALLAYILMRIADRHVTSGRPLLYLCSCYLLVLVLSRFFQRMGIKYFRQMGHNTRTATFVGDDSELKVLYDKLLKDPTTGYRLTGVYSDTAWERNMDGEEGGLHRLGSIDDLMDGLNQPDRLAIGDELYVCLSRRDKERIRRLSHFCDLNVRRFFYLPVSVETLKIGLQREMIDDIEVWTTHESPLLNPLNKALKRGFDILFSSLFLLGTAILFPIIAFIIKRQSPGPIFFKQMRTGLDGKEFKCYKFRSMHVNVNADKMQATEHDPRKFPFGNFMRKANIDELPQFWNVLKGDMSLVGPRPHMLAHTEMYAALIDRYMVRHFVKPGITGWAQVTGYRGETKELWQMEGRVERDIWYMENWSIWLDVRIIWMTAKSIVVHDKNAY